MYSTILNLHSYWAFATLLLLLAAIVNAILGMTGNKTFSKTSYKWSLYGFIAAHIQLLLGLILLFVSPHWDMLMNNTSTVMKDSDTRLLAVEHPIINILA
ncbi:MAG: cytochrome B, partial [Saprospiraceae bacterium]